MNFQDEYEFEIDGETYYVAVTGYVHGDEHDVMTEVKTVKICDQYGEDIDEDSVHYPEIIEDAKTRQYDIEMHTSDFSYYGEIA